MFNINDFGVAAAALTPAAVTPHAAPAAAGKHRVAAATAASVDRGFR